MLGTSVPADAPPYVTANPVEAAPATVAVPAKPAMPLIAVSRFAFEYGGRRPPRTTGSFPPIRTWNGEKNVAVAAAPPEAARPATAVYSKLRAVGTAVIWNTPL